MSRNTDGTTESLPPERPPARERERSIGPQGEIELRGAVKAHDEMLMDIEQKRDALLAKQAENAEIKKERLETAKIHSARVKELKRTLLQIEDNEAFTAVNTDLQTAQQKIDKDLAALVPQQVNVALPQELVNSPMFQRAEVALGFHALACSSVKFTPEEICFLNAGTLYPVIRAVLEIPAQELPGENTDAGGVMTLLANRSLAILANINGFAIMLRKTMAISDSINAIVVSDIGPDAYIEQFSNVAVEYEQAIHELNIVCECAVRAILNKDGVVQRIVDIFKGIPELICKYGKLVLRYAGNATVGVFTVQTLFPGALGPFKVLLEMGAEAVPLVANFASQYPFYYAVLGSYVIVHFDDYVALLAEHATNARDFALGLIPASLLNPAWQGGAGLQAAAAAGAGAGAAQGGVPAGAAGGGLGQLFHSNSRVTLFRPDSHLGQIESGLFLLFNRVTDSFVRTFDMLKRPPLLQVASKTLDLARNIVSRLYVFRNEFCSTNPATPFDVKPELLRLLDKGFKEGNFLLFTAEMGLIAHSLNFQCRILAASVVNLLDALDVRTGNITQFRSRQEDMTDTQKAQVGSESVSVEARHALIEAVGEFNSLFDATLANEREMVGVAPNVNSGPIPQKSMPDFRKWLAIASKQASEDTEEHVALRNIFTSTEESKSVDAILEDPLTPKYIKDAIRAFRTYLEEENRMKLQPPPPSAHPTLMAPERPIVQVAQMAWDAIQKAIPVLMACAVALKPDCGVQPGGHSVERPQEDISEVDMLDADSSNHSDSSGKGGKSRTHRRRAATTKRSRRKAYNKKSNKRKSRKQLSRKKISRRRQSRRK